jgi:hypothetical protein
MIYRTCIGCVKAAGQCSHRDYLRQKLAGMGLTSIKFVCALREAPFNPGDAVWVELITSDPEVMESGYTADFPATIIRVTGSKAVARVDLDAQSACGDYDFEAKNENGFVKRPLKFFKPREGERRVVCPVCSALDGNHEYGWTCHAAAEREKQEAERAAERTSEVIF